MITLFVSDFNDISQKSYDDLISSVDLINLSCPCCSHGGCMTVHGYYIRHIKRDESSKAPIRIMRVKCSFCDHTHALLPASVVPYSWIPLAEQNTVLDLHVQGKSASAIADRVPSADENNVKAIIRRYLQHWLERLLTEMISRHPLPELVRGCFRVYSRQFLQIRRTKNILFLKPTQPYLIF